MKTKSDLLRELRMQGIDDNRVIISMSKVKREDFIPGKMKDFAYENIAIPIGEGQTTSQPYTVAYMLKLLGTKPGNKILEIGTGSGYNAAVMSHLTGKKGKIISLEINKNLHKLASKNIGLDNVLILNKDGYHGYEEEAPYDRIIITASAPEIPTRLIEQLKPNGIMVIPIKEDDHELMTKITKNEKITMTYHGRFQFVPMTGKVEDS